MNSIQKIRDLLKNIDRDKKNNTGSVYINIVKNEFININGRIEVPKIPVKELDYDRAALIMENIIEYIPEFFKGHDLLVSRKPASEQHSLHFVKLIKGRLIDFIHIFKIYLKFEGDSRNIIERGNCDFYPSYHTDRIYYKSRLIPVNSVIENNSIVDFTPIQLIDADYVESDQNFFTSAVFDDVNKKGITNDIYDRLNLDVFNISPELYPFIAYDYFTACFNVLHPVKREIDEAIIIFEPVFLLIYNRYNELNKLKDMDEIRDKHSDSIELNNGSQEFSDEYLITLKDYFQRFSIYRDDDLSLKGWWRLKF